MSIVAAFAVPHPPLIIPGVADDEREQIPDTVAAYKEVGRRIARLKPETIVISSPHAETHLDYLHISGGVGASGNFARFGAPHARYSATYDQRFVRELCNEAEAEGIAAGTVGERSPELDHGTMIPWYFAREGWRHAAQEGELPANTPLPLLMRMGISGLSPLEHYRLGQAAQHVAERLGRRVVYIASGDLSHKLKEDGPSGLAPEGAEFDASTCDAFKTGNFLELLTMEPGFCKRAAECGLRSFQIMVVVLDRTPVTSSSSATRVPLVWVTALPRSRPPAPPAPHPSATLASSTYSTKRPTCASAARRRTRGWSSRAARSRHTWATVRATGPRRTRRRPGHARARRQHRRPRLPPQRCHREHDGRSARPSAARPRRHEHHR